MHLKLIAIGIYFTVLISLLSCFPKKQNHASEIIQSGMEKSILILERYNEYSIKSLENKSQDPFSSYRALIWLPRAQKLHATTDSLVLLVKKYKNEIGKSKTREISRSLSNQLFSAIHDYQKKLLLIDSNITEQLKPQQGLIPENIDSLPDADQAFYSYYFSGHNLDMEVLTILESNIRLVESRVLKYMDNKCPEGDDYFESWSVIVGQTSSIIAPGEKLSITAGVGSFSKKAAPNIKINGIRVPINENAVSIYSFKGALAPGKYSIPVSLEFKDEFGKITKMERKVNYTVRSSH